MDAGSNHGCRWAAPLAARLGDDPDAAQITDTTIGVWREIEDALHPLIGHRGVAALYNRSVSLTAPAYPWLAIGHKGALDAIDTSALKGALEQQTPEECAAAGSALLQSFHELLANLIGGSLTDRLLRAVWQHSLPHAPVHDNPS
jgi:hypothetical protein